MNICNKYETQKLIGKGAQGSVFLAIDNRLGRRVAIKSLHKEFISDETQFKRFEEEAKILATLNHNSIVTLYDFCYDDEGFYLVMELVKGKPLDKYIRDKDCDHESSSCTCTGPIAEIRTIDIFIKILNGINYIHEKNIVHRDIRPVNI